MKTFEYNPFSDVYVPYIQEPELTRSQRARMFWESVLVYTPIPFMTKWMIYRAFRDLK